MIVARSHIVRDLERLGLEPGDAAMVHCRMSSLGRVVGGAETVVRALLDAVGADGTLMAYLGWEDEPPEDLAEMTDDAKRIFLEEHPVYDPKVGLSRRDHGRVAESLRTWPGAFHSGHPEAGVAAVGAKAEFLSDGHPRDDAYGADTPYARFVEVGGKVVMLGAPLDTVTLVHHIEAISEVPGKRRVEFSYPVIEDGERVWRDFSDINTSEGAFEYERVIGGEVDYIEYIARAAIAEGAGRSGKVGEATAHIFDSRRLVEFGVAWIEANFK